MWERGLKVFCSLIVAANPSIAVVLLCEQRFCPREQTVPFLLQLSSLGGTFYCSNGRGGRDGGVESGRYPPALVLELKCFETWDDVMFTGFCVLSVLKLRLESFLYLG